MPNKDLMSSEAGLMLIAEEFDYLGNINLLRIVYALATMGPLTTREIRKLGLGKPYRIGNLLKSLVDDGKVMSVRRVCKIKPGEPPTTFVQYYIADEFIAAALNECCEMLERTHRAYADGFVRMGRELKPLV